MKILSILLLFFNLCISQIDTLSLSFYPLGTGNYWEYEKIVYSWDGYPPTYDTIYYSINIIGDTLMPNFQSYKIIKKTNLDTSQSSGNQYLYERVDSSLCNVYQFSNYIPNNEYLIDSLKSMINDTSNASHDLMFGYRHIVKTVCTNFSMNTYFSVQKYAKHFEANVLYPFQYDLIQDIGLFSFHNSFDFGWMNIELKFAIIDGISYGHKINPIQGLEKQTELTSFELHQNYPNPFNPTTSITFDLPKSGQVTLKVFNILGEEVTTLVSKQLPAGSYTYDWDGSGVASGVYLYGLEAEGYVETRKMVMMR